VFAVVVIDGGEIDVAVAVESWARTNGRRGSGRNVGVGFEGAVALADENADHAVVVAGHGEIGLAVAIEIGGASE